MKHNHAIMERTPILQLAIAIATGLFIKYKKEGSFMVFDLICVTKDVKQGQGFCLTDCGPADGCNPDD